jgi:hypothetical protein
MGCKSLVFLLLFTLVGNLSLSAAFMSKGFQQHELMDARHTKTTLSGKTVFDRIAPSYGLFPVSYEMYSPQVVKAEYTLQYFLSQGYQNNGYLNQSWPIVLNGQAQHLEVLAPVVPEDSVYGYGNLAPQALGPGALEGKSCIIERALVPLAITSEYAKIKGRNLKDALQTVISTPTPGTRHYGGDLDLAEFDPLAMIQDPDQLLGWDYLILTERELEALGEPKSEHRALAFEHFLKRGGQLWIIDDLNMAGRCPASWQALDLGKTRDSANKPLRQYAVGLGLVNYQSLDDIEWKEMVGLRSSTPLMPKDFNETLNFGPNALIHHVPTIQSSVLGFLLMVVAFAIIVGPINMWWFCRGNRLRLVLTTPIISLCSAIVFSLLIIALEGFGGEGARSQVRYVDASRHQDFYQQVQLSRTGVVLNGGFELPTGVYSWPLELDTSFFKLSRPASSVSLANGWAGAGWFSSRNLQAQLFRGSAPSRGRLELQWKAGGPVALSTLEQRCENLWVIQRDKIYSARDVKPGHEVVLKEDSEGELFKILGNLMNHFKACAQKGQTWFVATSNDSNAFVPSLVNIRWTQHQTLWLGPLSPSELP